jgi:branched-chain amino acid transport system ATP-binding protein
MLKVEGLHTYYGRAHILSDVGFEVVEGEVLVLLGRNGAGKSTTMKSIMGLVPPAQGCILFHATDITGKQPFEIARLGVGYVPEERRVFTELTVEENLEVGRRPPNDNSPAWTPEKVFTLFPNLARMRDRAGSQMSGGEQQMLTIARTLMGNPTGLLLDEPSEGLAPVIVERIGELLRKLRDMGVTVLLAEQNMHFCMGIASHALVIDKGTIVYRDTIEALRADDEVKKRYLAL